MTDWVDGTRKGIEALIMIVSCLIWIQYWAHWVPEEMSPVGHFFGMLLAPLFWLIVLTYQENAERINRDGED